MQYGITVVWDVTICVQARLTRKHYSNDRSYLDPNKRRIVVALKLPVGDTHGVKAVRGGKTKYSG